MVLVQTEGGTEIREFFRTPFRTDRGVIQGFPVSPKIFNVVVDTVVIAVLMEVCGIQETHHRFGWSAVEHEIFYMRMTGK